MSPCGSKEGLGSLLLVRPVENRKVRARRKEVQELNGRKGGNSLEAGAVKGKPMAAFDADAENEARLAAMVCSLKNKDECLMCGS